MQCIIGIEVLHRGLASAVAPHILIGHVAAVIVLIDMLLLLHVLAAGIGVLHLQQLADGIIVIVLHPAVRILHLHRAAHAVVSVGGGAAIVLGDSFELAQQVIGLGGRGTVGIGNALLYVDWSRARLSGHTAKTNSSVVCLIRKSQIKNYFKSKSKSMMCIKWLI